MYHAVNRAVGRSTVFEKVADYAAFEKVIEEAGRHSGMRLLGFCVMPYHWHLVLWPHANVVGLRQSGGDGGGIEVPATQRMVQHAVWKYDLAADDGEAAGTGINLALPRTPAIN